MEPLFINRTVMDKTLMREWFKEDIKKNHKMFTIGHICLIAAFLVLAVAMFVTGARMYITMFIVLGFFMVLLAVLFLLNMLFQPHIQVWFAMKRDKEKELEIPYYLMFYSTWVVMVRDTGDIKNPQQLKLAQEYMKDAEAMQEEFVAIAESIKDVNPADETRLVDVKEKLENLQIRMDALNIDMSKINQSVRFEYENITSYFATPSQYVIYFGQHAMLVSKNGFEKGTEKDFEKFAQMLAAIATVNSAAKNENNNEKV